jgi:hypothetical protein
MIKSMKNVVITIPKDIATDPSKTEIRIWEKQVDMFVKRREMYSANKCALYSVIWNQCSEAMQTKIKSAESFKATNTDSDSLAILKEIKGIAYKLESQKNIYLALDNAKCTFYSYQQAADETNANYLSKFKNVIEVIEHYRGAIGEDQVLVLEELKKDGVDNDIPTADELAQATKTTKNKAHAMAFLKRADKGRYRQLSTELENQYTRGTDQYPITVTEAYNLLVNYLKPADVPRDRNATRNRDHGGRGGGGRSATTPPVDKLSFAQREEPPIATIQCYNRQAFGHYASSYTAPHLPRGGLQLLQCGIIEEVLNGWRG